MKRARRLRKWWRRRQREKHLIFSVNYETGEVRTGGAALPGDRQLAERVRDGRR